MVSTSASKTSNMIQFKITYPDGTTVEVSLPSSGSASSQPVVASCENAPKKADEPASAVVVPEDPRTPAEGPFPTAPAAPASQDVAEVAESCDQVRARENSFGVKERGVGAGEGVEGGVGEEEGEVREGERKRGGEIKASNHVQHKPTYDHLCPDQDPLTCNLTDLKFPCENGVYSPPAVLCRDFVAAFGESFVRTEFAKARAWLMANPSRRKTVRGCGRYLNSWLSSAGSRPRQNIKIAAKEAAVGLLAEGKETSDGW